jgi:hypothetical protein
MTVIMVSPQKRGNIGDKETNKTLPITCLPIEQKFEKTIDTASRKEEDEERLMKFYPFMKDTTITPPLIMMMTILLKEVPPFL